MAEFVHILPKDGLKPSIFLECIKSVLLQVELLTSFGWSTTGEISSFHTRRRLWVWTCSFPKTNLTFSDVCQSEW